MYVGRAMDELGKASDEGAWARDKRAWAKDECDLVVSLHQPPGSY